MHYVGAERRAATEGDAHASDVGRHHRTAARDGAVHRPVRGGRRRGQAPRRGRVHPRAEARARLPAARRPSHRRRTATGCNLNNNSLLYT